MKVAKKVQQIADAQGIAIGRGYDGFYTIGRGDGTSLWSDGTTVADAMNLIGRYLAECR